MKRTLKGLLLTAMLAVPAVFAISACSKSDPGTGGNQPSSPTETSQAPAHDHVLQFDSFVWDKSVSGSWTAKAKLVCTADDGYSELKDAQVIRTGNAPTCTEAGGYHYKAVYMGNENEQDEVLSALGHDWNEPTWTWNGDNTEATAKFVCKRDAGHIEEVVAKQSEGDIECLRMDNPHCLDEGLDKYVATVEFHGKEYKGEKEVVLPPTGHSYNVFGYCLWDKAYLGQEIPNPMTVTLPAIKAGEKAYYSYDPAWVGHKLYYTCSAAIDSCEVRFGKLGGTSFDSLDFSKTPTKIKDRDIGSDGLIYIYIKANTDIAAGEQFTLHEDCDLNEAGYCMSCETFDGYEFSVGAASDPVTVAVGDVVYFRCPAIPGHTYKVSNAGGAIAPSDIVGRYYIGAEGVVSNYDLSDPFPADAFHNYIYLKVVATYAGTDGKVRVDFLSHPVGEMGYCDAHRTVFVGQELTNNTPSNPVNLAPGEVAYYKFIITQDDCSIEVNYDFDHYNESGYQPGTQIDHAFFKVDDVFFECLYNDMSSGLGCTVWDKSYTKTFEIGDVVIVKVENKWSFNMDNLVINVHHLGSH